MPQKDGTVCVKSIDKYLRPRRKVKQNAREKRQQKREFMENKKKLFTAVLPTLGVFFALIVALVYMCSRPKSVIEG